MNKRFSERLNRGLDNIGAPESNAERIEALAKLLEIRRFKAEALLSGTVSPDEALLKTLARVLEVNVDWLAGKSEAAH